MSNIKLRVYLERYPTKQQIAASKNAIIMPLLRRAQAYLRICHRRLWYNITGQTLTLRLHHRRRQTPPRP